MQNSLSIRQRFTPAQRQSILHAYARRQLSQREFAAGAGLSLSTLHGWLRKSPASQASGLSGFVPLPNPLPRAAAPVYRLEFPGGVMLEVPSGFDAAELGSLVQTLRAL